MYGSQSWIVLTILFPIVSTDLISTTVGKTEPSLNPYIKALTSFWKQKHETL